MGGPEKQVLVIGGGVAGMAAAKVLSQYGLYVHLVEKGPHLGGHAVRWACMATDQCRNCGACLSVEMVDRTQRAVNIKVYVNTHLEALNASGPGYRAILTGPAPTELTVDGIVVATGMQPFDPSIIESLHYGHHPRVITTAELNRLLQTNTLAELIGHNADPAIAFIQCVGSRNKRLGNDYCSQVCCKVAVRQAAKLRHLMPQAGLSIFHIDLQLIGKEIRSQARDLQNDVTLLQGVTGEIRIDPETDRLVIVREDATSGLRQAHSFDLVVLAVGMRPADHLRPLLDPLGVHFDSWGFLSGQDPLPSRLQVAGAGRFPTDIVGAMLEGANAAHRIAADLGGAPAGGKSATVAIFANGQEGHHVARAVQAAGYSPLVVDAGETPGKPVSDYEQVASAHITGLDGTAGCYTLRYVHGGKSVQRQIMALVVANGTVNGPAPSSPVVDLAFIEQALPDALEKIPSRIVLWLDRHGPERKTNFRRALESAVALSASGRQVTVIMERVLVHGPDGQQLYDRARGQGVRFLRATDAAAVTIVRIDGGLELTVEDSTLPGVPLSLECDLVATSGQILPDPHTAAVAGLIKESLDREGFAQAANVRLRPINSRKKGIFYVGTCHEENNAADIDREIRNLICQLALMDRQAPVLDDTAHIDEGRCGRCLTCFRTCPHGAVAIMRANQPQVQSQACMGCGLCVAQCPARAISLGQDPLEKGAQGQTVVYACGRSGYLAATRALEDGLITLDETVSIVRVPCCRSRIGVQELLDPLLAGARRVVVAACHTGNCQSVDTGQTADVSLRQRVQAIGLLDQEICWRTVAANEPAGFSRILTPASNKAE